jgi:type I restriction enzyme S subunit
MKSTYKQLGDYIEPCDEKNSANEPLGLRGISNQKYFQKAKTNTIGVDLSTYRIVRTGQFAFNRATTRNGEKISIALCQEPDCIVSPSYRIFKSKDENVLNSEYLMMWFRRPEFDRYARFRSHGSAHEFFDYDEMCEVELPIPSIEKQREIVREYNTIVNRIQLNEQLIQKLEETAQAVYKRWFVEFEFPDENNLPYKSNGGKMVWNEELEKEIPEGWKVTTLLDYSILSQGIQVEVDEQFLEREEGMYRFLRIIDYTPKTDELPRYVNINDSRYYCASDEIAMIRYGDAGTVCRRFNGIIANNLFKISPKEPLTNNLLFYFLKEETTQRLIRTSAASSTMPAITHAAIKELSFILAIKQIIKCFDKIAQSAENQILSIISENQKLKDLKALLLSKMTKVEETTEKEIA